MEQALKLNNRPEEIIFAKLEKINHRPKPFEFYTTPELWNDPYVSSQMLSLHLDDSINLVDPEKG